MKDEQKEAPPKPKKHWLRKIFKYGLLCVLVILAAVVGAVFYLFQTESGQNYLVKTANSLMAPKPGDEGLYFKIASLSGSLPFNFTLGLEAYDRHGLWLSAPDNRFTLNWTELPGELHISTLQINNGDLSRFPDTPPSQPDPEPTQPFTIKDLNQLLIKAHAFLNADHAWLPRVKIENVAISDFRLPEDLLPQTPPNRLAANLGLEASFIDKIFTATANAAIANADKARIDLPSLSCEGLKANMKIGLEPGSEDLTLKNDIGIKVDAPRLAQDGIPADYLGEQVDLSLKLAAKASDLSREPVLSVELDGPALLAGHIQTSAKGDWRSGDNWKNGELDGPIDYALNLDVAPVKDPPASSPLAMLPEPVSLNLAMKGNLPALALDLKLACARIARDNHNFNNLLLAISSPEIDLPLGDMGAYLQKENHISMALSGDFDKNPIDLNSQILFRQLADGWQAGVKNFRLDGLGMKSEAEVDATLLKDQNPSLAGNLALAIDDWKAIEAFVPNQSFSGSISVKTRLEPGMAEGRPSQGANVLLNMPMFAIKDKTGILLEIKGLNCDAKAQDLFHDIFLDTDLEFAGIHAADMDIKGNLRAKGAIKGPIDINLATSGNVKSKIAAQWKEGQATLRTLDVDVNLPKSPLKKLPLGIHSQKAATILYGDQGISVRDLDIKILPTGYLRASGGLSADKMDLNLKLGDLNFKPLQQLSPQIPGGSASIEASLKGSPSQPRGDFNLTLKDIAVPGAPLKPITCFLKGNIVNSGAASALRVALDLDPATLKALGSEKARIAASIPLLFASNGVPDIEKTKPLSAQVRWDGALGPIWNLLPIPDRRLNGRLNINIDAAGTLERPVIKGGVKVEKARYEDLLLGVLITDINLTADLTEDGKLAQVKKGSLPGEVRMNLTASDGHKGTVSVKGHAALTGEDLDITAKIDHLKPLRRRDVHIELSGDASVHGSATAPDVKGEIVVNQGEVLLDNLDIAGSVTTLPITTPEEMKKKKEAPKVASATPKGSGSLDLRLNMLPRFVVEGRGLTSIWQAHLQVGGTPQDPRITGNISSVRGNFDFLGKNFFLTKGVVFFGGGSVSNPLLDIELTNETPDLTAHILVTGPVSKIKLTLTSDPSLPRDEILSQVLFGKNMSDLSKLEALQLAGAVAQLAGFGSGGGILSMAKKTLGVDVLRLGTASEASGDGEETSSGATLEMGKYINDMIYMGVQQGMKADSTAFIIQMELTPRTSMEVRTEQNNTWGGLKWKYNY